jgi:signal transduction histidine kinase
MEARLQTESDPGMQLEAGGCSIDRGELRTLLSSLSHELCRPLASLRAGFELLLGDPANPVTDDQRGHLLTMVSLCDELLGLTRGYLDYAGLVGGGRPPTLGTFSMGALIREIDRQFRPDALARGLFWDAAASCPEAEILTDASFCQQIFGNLVNNAIKYTPAGGHVRIEAEAGMSDWCVAVTDDGPGIPAESLDRVFEPFFRLPRDEHSRIEGNGLGLAICRELCEQLGGKIVIDSNPGAGTTVKVQFPRNPRGEAVANTRPKTSAKRKSRAAGQPRNIR